MAKWEHVRDYLRANYKIQKDESDFLEMVFEVGSDRSQLVFVSRDTMEALDYEFALISSPFAKADSVDLSAALREAGEYVVGGVVQHGDALLLRHSVPLANLDLNELTDPLKLVLHTADLLEQKFSVADDF